MTILKWSSVTAVSLVLLGADANAGQQIDRVFEPGVDQQVLTPLIGGDPSEPLFVARRFLEARKAKAMGLLSNRASLELRSLGRNLQPILDTEIEVDRDEPVWVGPLGNMGGNASFAVRHGRSPLQAFRVRGQSVSPHLLPWQSPAWADRQPSHERAYFVPGGVVGVRTEGGVRLAEYWAEGKPQPVAIPWSFHNGDGRVSAIHDVAASKGRVLVLLTIQRPSSSSTAELWIARLDLRQVTATVEVERLDTGRLGAGEFEFIRTSEGPTGVRVIARRAVTLQPVLKIYSLNSLSPIWSEGLERLESGRDTAVAGVCGNSFLVARRLTNGRDTEVALTLIGPSGSERKLASRRPNEREVFVSFALHSIGERVLLYANSIQLEPTRRADGWYSWLGYSVETLDSASWCRE
jgi:hypothetical protein